MGDKSFIIRRRIDTAAGVLDNADVNRSAQGQDAQLFELLEFFQRLGRKLVSCKQELPAIGVQPQVLQEAGRPLREIGLAVADEGNRTAAEIESPAMSVADHLDAGGIVPGFQRTNRHGQGGQVRAGSPASSSGSRSSVAGR